MIKVGIVTALSPSKGAARVRLSDNDSLVTYWLPVIQGKTHKDKHYNMPDVGELVVCAFLDNGIEDGFIIGAIYNNSDSVPVSSADKFHKVFSDGSSIEYDRKSHKLAIVIDGEIDITASAAVKLTCPSFTVDCPESTFTGKVTIQGLLTWLAGMIGSGGGAVSAVINGILRATKLKTDAGIDVDDHRHGGVAEGDDVSGGPQ